MMSTDQMYTSLNTGARMPIMAFGTLMESLQPDFAGTVEVIKNAIDVGYRHMDGAQVYNTEAMMGVAIKEKITEGVITREDMFITTKLWRTSFAREDVVPALRKSLRELQMDYVDLFLIHWPTAFKSGKEMFPKDSQGNFIYADIDYLETWKGMEECYELGLAKAIGVSNFNSKQLQRIIENSKIYPANNQIESHPYLTNKPLAEFCHKRGISVTAYAPLAGFNPSYREDMKWPTIYTDEKIKSVATKYNKTPAQVALRYQLERGIAVAPKSSKKHRMVENYQALDFKLTPEDCAVLDSCDQGMRLNAELPDHPHYPFNEPF